MDPKQAEESFAVEMDASDDESEEGLSISMHVTVQLRCPYVQETAWDTLRFHIVSIRNAQLNSKYSARCSKDLSLDTSCS